MIGNSVKSKPKLRYDLNDMDVYQDEQGQYNMVPFAKMFNADPYEELDPPVTYDAVKLDEGEAPDNTLEFPGSKD